MDTVKNNEWLNDSEKKNINWNNIFRFAAYYYPLRNKLFIVMALAFIFAFAAYLIPVVFAQTQAAFITENRDLFLLSMLGYLGILTFQSVMTYSIKILQTSVFTWLNKDVLLRYYSKLLNISVPDYLAFKNRTNLFQRVMDVVLITSDATNVFFGIIISGISVVIFGGIIFYLSPLVFAVLIVGSVFLILSMLYYTPKLRNLRQRCLAIGYPLVSKMIEIIEGLVTIKTLTASVSVTSDITELIDGRKDAEYNEGVKYAEADLLKSFIRNSILIAAVSVSFYQLLIGQLPVSDVFALYILISSFLSPVQQLVSQYLKLSTISVNINKYMEIIDLENEFAAPISTNGNGRSHTNGTTPQTYNGTHKNGVNTIFNNGNGHANGHLRGNIRFNDVRFGYEESQSVLKNIDVEISEGQRVVLIGKSGAGKTTLMRLLLGFMEPDSGSISVDGKELSNLITSGKYRKHFGIVSQNDFLFNVSIRENLLFGLSECDKHADLETVLRAVNLWDDIAELEDGVDTIFEKERFSGGQKQRLIIARALIRDPDIVLLDEPTTALDFENERIIGEALEALVGGKTSLTIAHKLSTIKSADLILVLKGGRIVDKGTHSELLTRSEYYRSLCEFNSFIV
ncbi:MAG: ABC transporter ATP-binding protein [Calditrichia bacterium]